MSLELGLQKRPIFSDQLNCTSTCTKTLFTEPLITTMLILFWNLKTSLYMKYIINVENSYAYWFTTQKFTRNVYISLLKSVLHYIHTKTQICPIVVATYISGDLSSLLIPRSTFSLLCTLFYLTNILLTWQLFILILSVFKNCTVFKNKDYFSRTTNVMYGRTSNVRQVDANYMFATLH